MQIAEFLEIAKDEILSESVALHATILRLKDEDDAIPPNHLPLMLEALSTDLRTAQCRTEPIQKSHGSAKPGGLQPEARSQKPQLRPMACCGHAVI